MSAGRHLLYCCFYQSKKRKIFCKRAGHDGQISATRVTRDICAVMAGLDPAIHVFGPRVARVSEAIRGIDTRISLALIRATRALIACARKLLIYANTVVARGTPWVENAAQL
jgi:hypothetical protein